MQNTKPLSPWYYIPSAYFLEGLPWALVNMLAGVIYVKMDVPIATYAFWTGLLGLPWIIKMFWAPLVDATQTKRRWLLGAQYLMGAAFALAAASLLSGQNFFPLSLICFFVGAMLSATHDIALDGYYMLALDAKNQSMFVGVRTAAYRVAMVTASGPLVILAGWLEARGYAPNRAFSIALLAAAGLIFALNTYHLFILPCPAGDKPQKSASQTPMYVDAFKKFLTQQGIWYIIIFMLFFRIGDMFLLKMLVPFLLRGADTGALALPTASYGVIKGTFGVLAVLGGNIVGGFFLARYGFKKCIWWFAAMLVLPNFLYALAAANAHAVTTAIAGALVVFEHFGDGIGYMSITMFMLIISRGEYKTSFYAIGTGLMAFGTMAPPMMSGKIFELLGSNYVVFFTSMAILSLSTFLIVPLMLRVDKVRQSDMEINKGATK